MASQTHDTLTSACLDSAGSAIGMPQLCAEWIPNQIFWLIVALGVIFLILSKVALPRIGSILAERTGVITNDLAVAEDLKQKVVDAENAYQKALSDARAQAAQIVQAAKDDIEKELNIKLEAADAQISEKTKESEALIGDIRKNAAQSVRDVSLETAQQIVATLGADVSSKDVKTAVSAQLKG